MLDKLKYISIFWRIFLCESLYIYKLYTTYQNNQMKNIWSLTINRLKENHIIIYWFNAYNLLLYAVSYFRSTHEVLFSQAMIPLSLTHNVTAPWIFINIIKINCLVYIFWNCALNSIIFAQTILWMSNYRLTTNANVIIL